MREVIKGKIAVKGSVGGFKATIQGKSGISAPLNDMLFH